jgi:hypothetical protein
MDRNDFIYALMMRITNNPDWDLDLLIKLKTYSTNTDYHAMVYLLERLLKDGKELSLDNSAIKMGFTALANGPKLIYQEALRYQNNFTPDELLRLGIMAGIISKNFEKILDN